jgi:hypothetical protein
MAQKYQVGDIVRVVRERDGESWERVARIEHVKSCSASDCTYGAEGSHMEEGRKVCKQCDGSMYNCRVITGKGKDYKEGQDGAWAGYNMQKLTDEELAFYLL